ncbi:MerR family transcriptional regulator [Priestia megaterium]|jgi:DNA-binding transcriptional MerR regulator|uniref:MerR family transcriptional regulator n=1 Tax=Priestia megaterium TaxID=1404 RepID=UPI0011A9D62B|nr:MerR family transcriptional regulator [Priestia megaterium]MCM3016877.1 MerR family transcriptional regulator [Priestia megaterium]MCM3182437.1 MerR family transcriptional regulator [Priestia megaterium]MED3915008.1 MerR family transcriptional regulator [Priestia megaterium]
MNYTIGQIAKMNHLSISQLRYYDNQGLFPFLKRTEKGNRVFDEDALKFLDIILCLKNTGMPIRDIKQFVDWSMNGNDTIPQRLEMMQQQEFKVIKQIRDTEENLKKIQGKISRLEGEMQN